MVDALWAASMMAPASQDRHLFDVKIDLRSAPRPEIDSARYAEFFACWLFSRTVRRP